LFGWDFNKGRSSVEGGILGWLKAFYGIAEYTGRGDHHGHFLLWLLGALNPTDLHEKLKSSPGFDLKVFYFFEETIKHHLPNIEVNIDKEYEPCSECPLHAPPSPYSWEMFDLDEWKVDFETEVKECGEKLWQHDCHAVCHIYGNANKCCFHYPHDVVEQSSFDANTNSLILKCLDGNVNYHNPYILVYCCHNHDFKSILSGKAAKGAMHYITDYITKMDNKTWQVLSLMSKAVLSAHEQISSESGRESAKILLQKCLSQFLKQQQLHAQQASHYIRGKTDSISPHLTVPMLSNLLMLFVKSIYFLVDSQKSDVDDGGGDESIEPVSLKLTADDSG